MGKKKGGARRVKRQFPVVELLEPRILLSADFPGLDGLGLDPSDPYDTDTDHVLANAQVALSRIEAEPTTESSDDVTGFEPPDTDAANADEFLLPASPEDTSLRHELIIIDPTVSAYEELIADLHDQTAQEVDFQVIVLDPQRDGIDQLSEILSSYNGLDVVHLISHGCDGSIRLGDTSIDLVTLQAYEATIRTWGNAFTADGDLMIYGCDLAATTEGEAFVTALSDLTGADVAASDDITGDAAQGGDWELEYQVGQVDSSSVTNLFAHSSWSQTLASITVTTTNDETGGDISSLAALQATPGGSGISLREAIIAANNTAGADTINLGPGTYALSLTGSWEDAAALGDLDITTDAATPEITIVGAGAGQTTISASGLGDRAFDVKSGATLTLQDLTVADVSTSNQPGGAVSNAGTFYATDVVFRDNTVASNPGGALYSSGIMTLDRVSLYNNTALSGGGIEQNGGSVALTNVTISNNTSDNYGAGITINTGNLDIDYTTVAYNSAQVNGYAGGLNIRGGTVNISNSIFANNTSTYYSGDVTGNVTSNGYNIFVDYEGFALDGTDKTSDPGLASVALDSGSGQYVHAITDSSIAHDAAGGSAPTIDQRSVSRDASPDIGAYEFASSNIPPVAANDSGVVVEDATLNVTAINGVITPNDTDADGDSLSVSAIRTGAESGSGTAGTVGAALSGAYGTLTLNADGSYSYVADQAAADALAAGATANDIFTYTVSDGNGGTDTAELVIQVTGTNDVPVATANTVSTPEDNAYTFSAGDFTFTDTEGDSLVSATLSNLNLAGGTLVHSGATTVTNGMTLTGAQLATLVYTPASNATGTPLASFDFTVNDSGTGVSSAQMAIDVTPVNDVPVAVNDGGAVAEDATLSVTAVNGVVGLNDTDSDGDSLSVSAIRTGAEAGSGTAGTVGAALSGTYGTLTLNTDGSYSYVANQAAADALAVGATANDIFTYTVSDGNGGTDTAELVIQVTGTNDAPLITSDGGGASASVSATENQTAITTVTASDIDGDTPTFAVSGGADAALFGIDSNTGALTFSSARDFETYTDADNNGVYEVEVTVSDGNGGTDVQQLSVTVTDLNETPVDINPDGFNIDENSNTNGGPSLNRASTSNQDNANTAAYRFVDSTDETRETPSTTNATTDDTAEGQGTSSDEQPPPQGDREGNPRIIDRDPFDATVEPVDPDEVLISVLRNRHMESHVSAPFSKPTVAEAQTLLRSAPTWKVSDEPDPQSEPTRTAAFWRDLDASLNEFDRAADSETERLKLDTEVTTGLTISLTAGFVSWILRAGSLIGSFLASMPAWRNFDPLPILANEESLRQCAAPDGTMDQETRSDTDRKVQDLFETPHGN